MSTSRTHKKASSAHSMSMLHEQTGPAILQLNVEGLTRPKYEIIQNIAYKNCISVILLQETTLPVTIRSRSMVSLWLELSITVNKVSRPWSGMTYQQNLQTTANLTAKCNGLMLLSMMNLPSLTSTSPQVQPSYHPQSTATLLSIQETLILATNRGDTQTTTLTVQPSTNGQATMILIYYTIQNNQRHFIRLYGTLSLTQILHSTWLMLIISLHIRHKKSVKISQDHSIAQPSSPIQH